LFFLRFCEYRRPKNRIMLQGVLIGREGVLYGCGVVIHTNDPFGVVYGHYGVIPGYTSSMRYLYNYKVAIAFQINTDKGVFDHTSNLLEDMEKRLAQVIITTAVDT
jgi:D-alanyl-D-alanine carboxypeptidase